MKALLVTICPVSLSVERVELLRSMILGRSAVGGIEDIAVSPGSVRALKGEEESVGMTPTLMINRAVAEE